MIYFISDIHLGSRAIADAEAHQQRFVDLLQTWRKDATAVYILGDMFDFWHEYFWDFRLSLAGSLGHFEPFRPTLLALRSLTQSGVEVHLFVGNHDMWTYGWLARETGVQVHYKPELMTIAGKQVFLAHGDGVVPSDFMARIPEEFRGKIRKFILLRKLLFLNPVAKFLMRILPACVGDKWGYEWAKHSRLRELAHPLEYKGENNEELVLYAKEQERTQHIDYYIFGHRHILLDLMLASRARVAILGDFFRQFTYAQLDDNILQLCIQESNN